MFFVDSNSNVKVNWSDLILDLNKVKTYNQFCIDSDYYSIIKNIIISLLYEKPIILLDSDFSDDELNSLIGLSRDKLVEFDKYLNNSLHIEDQADLLHKLNKVGANWSITLFTSGTTGLPKKVTHTFESISRFVKISTLNFRSVWGLAFNPTHMAGVQVFFQAVLNGNAMVRLFGLGNELIHSLISEYEITNISATPTFYRMLLPTECIHPNVVRITTGGEIFDDSIRYKLSNLFPNAKVVNVYALTEAGSVLASDGDCFSIKLKYDSFVKVADNEILIHKNLMGQNFEFSGEWYKTGDIVEILSENPLTFKFTHRKNEMINVGGYKVNPKEIEEVILSIPSVKEVKVYAKKNSVLGNIVVADVVRLDDSLDEYIIRLYLKERLQEFKIPRFIKFVDKVIVSRTGKKN